MFTTDKKYISEEISTGGNFINKSGAYEVQITEARIWAPQNSESRSEALNLSFEDSQGRKAWVSLFYKKKDGTDLDFNLRHINHLAYLVNVDPQQAADFTIPNLTGKVVGVILKVDGKLNYEGKPVYDFQLQGFYDPKTKQTAKEKHENKPVEIYNKMVERYKDAVEVDLSKLGSNNSNEFGPKDGNAGYYTIDNDDIPF